MKTKVEGEETDLNQEELARQIQILQDSINLRDESYYRQLLLTVLTRIAISLERQADWMTSEKSIENKIPSPPQEEDEEEYEEDETEKPKPKPKLKEKIKW